MNSSTSRDRASKRMPGACTAVGHDVGESDVGKAVGEDVVGPRKVGARVGARVTADSERRARMAAGVGPMAFLCRAYVAAVAGASSKMAAEPLSQSVQPKMLQPSSYLKMRGDVCNNGVAWHAHRQALRRPRYGRKCDHNPNDYICEPNPRKAT